MAANATILPMGTFQGNPIIAGRGAIERLEERSKP